MYNYSFIWPVDYRLVIRTLYIWFGRKAYILFDNKKPSFILPDELIQD